MIQTILAKIVGTQNERDLKKLRPIVGQVGVFEPAIEALSDDQLRGKTVEFRTRLANGEMLDDLLAAAGKRNGRVMTPSSQPEKGGFYRADHFEFSKRDLPALYTAGGKDFIGKPVDFGQ